MTLADLLIAMTIVPIVILAAGTFYLNAGRMMNSVYDEGSATLEKQQVMNSLEALVANGSSATPELNVPVQQPSNLEWRHHLTIERPGNQNPILIRFEKQSGSDAILAYCEEEDAAACDSMDAWSQISYIGAIDRNENLDPFVWDSVKKELTFNFDFKTKDMYYGTEKKIPASFDLRLQGGSGV